MLILAVDTSGKHGSIALARCGPGDACQVIEVVPLAGGTFSAQLVPQIAELLKKHGFSKHDLDGFAAASGPGSFTGLRVGLAAIKALAEALGKPIAAVSLLEAVAVASAEEGKVYAALDAGRGELYVGEYEHGKITDFGEKLLTREEFLALCRGRVVVTPDLPIAEAAQQAGADVKVVERPRSDSVARLGWKRLQSGQTVAPEDLEANYIRRSDAEIFSKPSL
jgi:tRNA threonylcarbamoyladenosine biosynthesis protein TsaB